MRAYSQDNSSQHPHNMPKAHSYTIFKLFKCCIIYIMLSRTFQMSSLSSVSIIILKILFE